MTTNNGHDYPIQISNTRNAGWAWRCWVCDENGFNHPDREAAVRGAKGHASLHTHRMHIIFRASAAENLHGE